MTYVLLLNQIENLFVSIKMNTKHRRNLLKLVKLSKVRVKSGSKLKKGSKIKPPKLSEALCTVTWSHLGLNYLCILLFSRVL